MEGFTKEQLMKALEYYDALGFSEEGVISNGEVLDLYRVLGAKPETTSTGSRKITPYEILGVPPQTVDGVNERPIIFAIKNRAKKIGNYTGEQTTFLFKGHKVKDELSILEQLKANYKRAILMGNEADAAKFLDLINQVTGGRAQEFLDSFYDYTKFYRRMKKQLLLDLFSHFFLMFMMAKTRRSTVHKGILKKDRIYKAYHEQESEYDYEREYIDALNQIMAANAAGPEFPVVTSVKFEHKSDDYDESSVRVEKSIPKATPHHMPAPPPPPVEVVEEKKEEPEEIKEETKFKYPTSLQDFFASIQDYSIDDNVELSIADSLSVATSLDEASNEKDFDADKVLNERVIAEEDGLETKDSLENQQQSKHQNAKPNSEKYKTLESQGFDFQA